MLQIKATKNDITQRQLPVDLGVVVNSTGFPGGSLVKNLPATQEMWVQSLGQENSLE